MNDVCNSGVCHGAARDCSDAGDQCNTGVCNEASAMCVPATISTPKDDPEDPLAGRAAGTTPEMRDP